MDYPNPTNEDGTPDGTTGATFEAISLLSGYWYDENMDDMSVALANGEQLFFAMFDSNNQDISNPESPYNTLPTSVEISEFADTGLDATIGNGYPDMWPLRSYVSSDGSIKLSSQMVPEPATLLLFGMGLCGLSGVTRKKFNS